MVKFTITDQQLITQYDRIGGEVYCTCRHFSLLFQCLDVSCHVFHGLLIR